MNLKRLLKKANKTGVGRIKGGEVFLMARAFICGVNNKTETQVARFT